MKNKIKIMIEIKKNGLPRIGTFNKYKTIKTQLFLPRCRICGHRFEPGEIKYVNQFCHICLTCAYKNLII
jgi:hypothetical protein